MMVNYLAVLVTFKTKKHWKLQVRMCLKLYSIYNSVCTYSQYFINCDHQNIIVLFKFNMTYS